MRRILLLAMLACAAVVLAALGAPSRAEDRVGVFPAPGTQTASPRTELSFRGVGAADLEAVEVVGDRSGPRRGQVREHADGQGASLVFAEPFDAPEAVTVRTDLDLPGPSDGDFRFATVPRPEEGLGSGSPPPERLLRQYTAQEGDQPPSGSAPAYRSRPDLRPPEVEILERSPGRTAPGLVFHAPKKVFGAPEQPGVQTGPMILGTDGEPVWFAELDGGNVADFRAQELDGEPVLTWWQGRSVLGTGEGEVAILDASYRPVARVRAGNGYRFDFHETLITDRGTLLGLVYNPVDRDLSSVGGPRDGRAIDSIVQEVDIETGRVLFEWHSLGNVALEESYGEVPRNRDKAFDYFHVNAIDVDDDGNLLVSGRDTWSVVKIDRRTGRTMWRLGGKRSDFAMAGESRFAWQHDARRAPEGRIRIFDNAAAPPVRERSRVLDLELDEEAMTARVARSIEHPDDLLSGTQGNAQRLPDGNVFVGWGSQGYFSEFAKDGRMLFDGRVARGFDSYRAYRMPWVGRPVDPPAIATQPTLGSTTVWASWNGATEVARWQVLAGPTPGSLRPVAEVARDGFETEIEVPEPVDRVAVRALDAAGDELGTSKAIATE
ncbi:MAG: arylsulfotransferase family protein [Actinomycetota bacterium]|nr:arylsulfotransferase family protein [Actinomycetota bacterium]